MANVVIDDKNLKDIANSIRTKAGTQETFLPEEMSVAINNIPTGVPTVKEDFRKRINFYDYDGTLIKSIQDVEKFQQNPVLPEVPAHDNLTFTGWNWEDGDESWKERWNYDAGATYKTTDNKLHIKFTQDIDMSDWPQEQPENNFIYVHVSFGCNPTNKFLFDWGDGSPKEEILPYDTDPQYNWTNLNAQHKYKTWGDFEIVIEANCENPTVAFWGNRASRESKVSDGGCSLVSIRRFGSQTIKEIQCPSWITNIEEGALAYCTNLEKINIPRETWINTTGWDNETQQEIPGFPLFGYCTSLKCVVLPYKFTWNNRGLPDDMFIGCGSLETIIGSINWLGISSKAVSNLPSLRFWGSNWGPIYGETTFKHCTNCYSIQNCDLGDIDIIDTGAFENCVNLEYVGVYRYDNSEGPSPYYLKTIKAGAFKGCKSLNRLRLERAGNPEVITLENVNAFEGVDLRGLRITVPQGQLALYQAAPNWKDLTDVRWEER